MMESNVIETVNGIIVKIKNERYMLEVNYVKEIFIPGEKIIPIPLSDKSVVGVIDIRGIIYTILSFPNAIFSGHGGDISYGLHTRMAMKLSGDVAVIFFINTHRIQRKGWNCAELLNDLLFLKAYSIRGDDFNQKPIDYIIDYNREEHNSLSFELIRDNIISNTFFINFLEKVKNISPIFYQLKGILWKNTYL